MADMAVVNNNDNDALLLPTLLFMDLRLSNGKSGGGRCIDFNWSCRNNADVVVVEEVSFVDVIVGAKKRKRYPGKRLLFCGKKYCKSLEVSCRTSGNLIYCIKQNRTTTTPLSTYQPRDILRCFQILVQINTVHS